MAKKLFLPGLALVGAFALSIVSCVKTDETFGSKNIARIALPKETLEMMQGDTVKLDVVFNSRQTAATYKEFAWRIEGQENVKIISSSGGSANIVGTSAGTTTIVVESVDRKLTASRGINVIGSAELLYPVYIDFGVAIADKPFSTVANPKNNK